MLTLNNFIFIRFRCLQKMGRVMGTICAPNYANVFMGKFERIDISLYRIICELLLSIFQRSILFVERKRERAFRFYS